VYADERNYEPLFRALAEEVTAAYVLAFYHPSKSVVMGSFTISGSRGARRIDSQAESPQVFQAEGKKQ